MPDSERLPPTEFDVDEILARIEEELDSRLDERPSEKDRDAIKSALIKAVVRGHAHGMSLAIEQANTIIARVGTRMGPLEVETQFTEELDPWADKYRSP